VRPAVVDRLEAVLLPGDIEPLQLAAADVYIAPAIQQYAATIVRTTRQHPAVQLGASPRATLHLLRSVQALALLEGTDFALPDHVKRLAPAVLGHRIQIASQSALQGCRGESIVTEILASLTPPTLPT
jgi:MoxR-like ATPase